LRILRLGYLKSPRSRTKQIVCTGCFCASFGCESRCSHPFLNGDKMYQYTVMARVANREIELQTFFDDDVDAEKKAKALIENNREKYRSMRIEKRIIGML